MGQRCAEEATAELVSQSPARNTDDEDDGHDHQYGYGLGAAEKSGHYAFLSPFESPSAASTAMSILNIPMIASASPKPNPVRVRMGRLKPNCRSSKTPAKTPPPMQMATYQPMPTNRRTVPILVAFTGPLPGACVVYHK